MMGIQAKGPGSDDFQLSPDHTADVGELPELGWIAVAQLSVDDTYQREERARHIKRIAREFSWNKFGAVIAGRRAKGGYFLIDGQQRVAACKRRGDIKEVPAVIVADTRSIGEAESFLGVNDGRVQVGWSDRHRAGLRAERDDAQDVERICAHYDLTISKRKDVGYIAATGTLYGIYRNHGEQHLSECLHLVCYGLGQHEAFKQAAGLKAISTLMRQAAVLMGEAYNYQEFAKRFSKRSENDVNRVIGDVKAKSVKVNPEGEMRSVLIRLHDRGRPDRSKLATKLLHLES